MKKRFLILLVILKSSTLFAQTGNTITYHLYEYIDSCERKMLVLYSDSIYKYITKRHDDSISFVSYGVYRDSHDSILLSGLPRTKLISSQEYYSISDTIVTINILNAKGRPYAVVDSVIIERNDSKDTIVGSCQDLNVEISRKTIYQVLKGFIKKVRIKTCYGDWIVCNVRKNESTRIDITITDIFVVKLEKERYRLFLYKSFKRENNWVINGDDVFHSRGVFTIHDNDDTESFIGREPNAANAKREYPDEDIN